MPGIDVLEREQEQVIGGLTVRFRKGLFGPGELFAERARSGGRFVKPLPVSLAISYSWSRLGSAAACVIATALTRDRSRVTALYAPDCGTA